MSFFPSLLFDRDGTLIEDRHYLADPAGVSLLPYVGPCLGRLFRQGHQLFMVSNQSGIGRGMFACRDADACNARLAELLEEFGAHFTRMLYCPHAPDENCNCRKPATGMWDTLREQYLLEAGNTIMVGDKAEDMEFASNAGLAAGVLVLSGKGRSAAGRLGIAVPPDLREPLSEMRSSDFVQVVIPDFSFLEEALHVASGCRVRACGNQGE